MVAHHRQDVLKDDSLYIAGVIYIDVQAGFTADFGVSFAITNKGLEKRDEYFKDAMFKIRLYGKNIADVAILSDKEIEQLDLPKEPDLLKHYGKHAGTNLHFAYAYNVIKNFDKAIDVLNKAIKNNPKDYMLYKELGFAFIHQNKLDNAEKAYLKGIELSTVKAQQAEMAHNMAYSYFQIKNKAKFEEWAKLTRKYADENSQLYRNMNLLEKNWDK
jgi:tetratricopeptide (TPR) repeat protein